MKPVAGFFKKSFLPLSFSLLMGVVGMAAQLSFEQTTSTVTIKKLVTENPHKAIQLVRLMGATQSADTAELALILRATAYLNLGYADSTQMLIDSIRKAYPIAGPGNLKQMIHLDTDFLLAKGNHKAALTKLNEELKQAQRKGMSTFEAELTVLKVDILKQQKLFAEAQRILQNEIRRFEKEDSMEAFTILSHSMANLCFQTEQFIEANQWYSKALAGYTKLQDTLSQITIEKNLSLTYRGLSQLEPAEEHLKQALNLAIAVDLPEELADIYNLMGSLRLHSGRLTEALEYYEQSRIIREELDFINSAASTIENISRVQRRLGNFDKASQNLRQVISLREQLNDQRSLSASYNEMGNLYAEQEKYADALMNYLTSLRIRQQMGYNEDIARSLTNIGLTYRKIGSYSNALNYLEQAIELIGTEGDPLSRAYIYIQHGNTLRDLNRSSEAIKSYSAALKLRQQTGNVQSVAQAYKSLAYAHTDLQQYTQADECLNTALNIARSLEDELQMADIFNELGNLRQLTHDYEAAIHYFEQAALLYSRVFDLSKRALCIRKIGQIQTILGQYHSAFSNLELALNLAEKVDNPKLKELTLLALYEYYLQKNDYQEALRYYTKHIAIRDSLILHNDRDDIWEASFNLELYKQVEQIKQIEGEMEVLRTEAQLNAMQLEKEKLLRRFMILTSFFIIVVALGTLYGYILIRKKNRHLSTTNAKLTQSEQELKTLVQTKDKLFSIIAHDLRSPFTALLGLTEILAQQSLDPKETQEFAQHLHQSSQKLLTLIENLLQWSRSQTGSIKLEPETINLKKLIQEIINVQQLQADTKEIKIHMDVDASHTLYADNNTLSTTVRNLISNGIKFTPQGGSIAIETSTTDKNTIISISDTGVGMTEEEVNKLFRIEESFSKPGTNNEVGTGLGLIVCKEFVEHNGGRIEVTSKLGMGTTFNLIFPRS